MFAIYSLTISIVIALFLPSNLLAAEKSSIIEIGQKEQLFLDDYIIEHITRRVNQAKKRGEPVIRPDRPWERGVCLIWGSVIYDQEEKMFKMWYLARYLLGYAISKDGLNWTKPLVGPHKTNLVVWRGKLDSCYEELHRAGVHTGLNIPEVGKGPFGHIMEVFGVLKDKKTDDPSRRYKGGFLSRGPGKRGLATTVSPDGIHWTLENNFASYEINDISHFFWDDLTDRYVLYGRTPGGKPRKVTRIESKDFRDWTKGEVVLARDKEDPEYTDIYSMSVFPYEGVYIGLIQFHFRNHRKLEIQLGISRDGRKWTRVDPRDPFIPEGKRGNWDEWYIGIADMPPVLVGDEMWFYYSGRRNTEGYGEGKRRYQCIGLARIKRGRFVSLEANADVGTVLTKPFIFQGSKLYLNADASAGSISVVVLDKGGRAISGLDATVSGKDDIAIPVQFKQGDLKKLAGKQGKIRFLLKNAKFYSFRVK